MGPPLLWAFSLSIEIFLAELMAPLPGTCELLRFDLPSLADRKPTISGSFEPPVDGYFQEGTNGTHQGFDAGRRKRVVQRDDVLYRSFMRVAATGAPAMASAARRETPALGHRTHDPAPVAERLRRARRKPIRLDWAAEVELVEARHASSRWFSLVGSSNQFGK
jgi:hypothetical protein